jgi:predicted DNA-binding transcriptional regulator AlpA
MSDRHFLITWEQLAPQIPYCRQHVAKLEKLGKFPPRVQLGDGGRVCWWQNEIDEFLASRPRGTPPQRKQLGPPKATAAPEPDAEDVELLRRLAAKHGLDLVPITKQRKREGRSGP